MKASPAKTQYFSVTPGDHDLEGVWGLEDSILFHPGQKTMTLYYPPCFSVWFFVLSVLSLYLLSFILFLLSSPLVFSVFYVYWFSLCCLCYCQPLATADAQCHDSLDGQGSEFLISVFSDHCIQFSKNSNTFLVWIMLKLLLLFAVQFIAELALELGYSFLFSRSISSLYPLSGELPDSVTGKNNKANEQKLD